jgi:hypothetical protein
MTYIHYYNVKECSIQQIKRDEESKQDKLKANLEERITMMQRQYDDLNNRHKDSLTQVMNLQLSQEQSKKTTDSVQITERENKRLVNLFTILN